MIKTGSPKTLWDHCIELEALVCSSICNDIYMTNGKVPETIMTGSTAEISHMSEFGWYDWVMLRDNTPTYPDPKLILGRYLRPATDVGLALTARILKANGQFVRLSTLRHLTDDELQFPVHIDLRRAFDRGIHVTLGPAATTQDFLAEDITPDDDAFDANILDFDPDQGDIEVTPEYGDTYVGAEILLPRGGTLARGCVTGWKRDVDGNSIGTAHVNLILDTRDYVITFDDGDVTELTANLIAESMYAQCDPDVNQYVLLDSIIDHRHLDTAKKLFDQTVIRKSGRTFKQHNTIVWQLCCQWKDGSTSWEKLSDLKESHPIMTAKYATLTDIDRKPAFSWWVPHVLKKRDRIISMVKHLSACYLKRTHKFDIEVPKTVNDAHELDQWNGNTCWTDAIAKEMTEVRKAFDIMPDGKAMPIGFQKIPCHMIFNVKIEDFKRKAQLVAGGYLTEAPATITYASVVSCETVRIALELAALNDL